MTAMPELVYGDTMRSVILDEAPGVRIHEVLASGVVESVTSDRRHPHSFAAAAIRRAGDVVQVRLNAPAVLRREVRRRSWRRETVVFGADDDPYQGAEEHYRLMPQMLSVLAEAHTPVAIYTSSHLVTRDVALLRLISHVVPVTITVVIGALDAEISRRIDPGAATPSARLDAIGRLASAGLAPRAQIAPLAPFLADDTDRLDELLAALAAAGATGVSVAPLRLDGAAGAEFLSWVADAHPALLRRYRSLYGRRDFVSAEYSAALRARMAPLVERHGLGSRSPAGEPRTGESRTGEPRTGDARGVAKPNAGDCERQSAEATLTLF